jgi:Fe-S cluster biosynthesis and repair protein YggX
VSDEVQEEVRMVHCKKLDKELPGLKRPPYRNELGKRIYDEISQEAWEMWKQESIRFINTYRLDLASKEGQSFLLKQAAVYFGFEDGELAQTAWTPPKELAEFITHKSLVFRC